MAVVENEKQKKAFDIYYSLGSSRTLKEVATKTLVDVKDIEAWSKIFRWNARVKERDKAKTDKQDEVEKILDDSDVDAGKISLEGLKKIITASALLYLKKLQKGEIKISSVKDITTLAEIYLALEKVSKEQDSENNADELTVEFNMTIDK